MKNLLVCIAVLCCASQVSAQDQEKTTTELRIQELKNITDSIVLQGKIDALLKSDQENEWWAVYQYYQEMKYFQKAGKFLEAGAQKFPKGEFDYRIRSIRTIFERDIHRKDSLLSELMHRYPDRKLPMQSITELLAAYANDRNIEKVWYCVDLAKKSDIEGVYLGALMQASLLDPKGAVKILERLYDSTKALNRKGVNAGSDKGAGFLHSISYAYATALLRNRQPEKAYDILRPLYKDTSENDFSELYVQTLIGTGRLKEAFPFMKDAIHTGRASDEVKLHFKDAYIAVHGSETGFEVYKTKLVDSLITGIRADVERRSFSEPAGGFTLKDVDGCTVSLSDYKGKVVILDFWATWCGPCKASFPAMQKAVNRYDKDTGVVFLFIHTLEKEGERAVKDAKEYVVQNNYSFRVLMDLKDPATKQNKLVKQYLISGIPTKIIIDPSGNMRFKVVGFNRNEGAALEELSEMIEYARRKA